MLILYNKFIKPRYLHKLDARKFGGAFSTPRIYTLVNGPTSYLHPCECTPHIYTLVNGPTSYVHPCEWTHLVSTPTLVNAHLVSTPL